MGKKIADKIKSIDSGCFLLFGIIGIVISFFMIPLAGTGNELLFIISAITPIISLIVFMYGGIRALIEKRNDDKKIIENMNMFQREYDAHIKELGIVQSDTSATLIEENEYGFHSSIAQYVWIENNSLKMFPMAKYFKKSGISTTCKPDVLKLKLKNIPIELKVSQFAGL